MTIIDKYSPKLKKEGFLVLAINVNQSAEVAFGSMWKDDLKIGCLYHPYEFSHRSARNHS